jgi:hypothetical protein
MIQIISLGAGVQSSTMALMAARGEIGPMPTAAIFADTGAEPKSVMRWLDWLETQLPFPVIRVMHREGLKADLLNPKGNRVSQPPLYTENGGILRRKCTGDFKVSIIKRTIRSVMETHGERKSNQWIGISTDEAHRMKPSGVKYSVNRWPLIEQVMSRGDCLAWMARNGYPTPPKSACTFCPYHSDRAWQQMKDYDPESWQEACEMDDAMRSSIPGVKERVYVHKSMVPLRIVKLNTAQEAGQVDMFGNECEGMCGV